MKNLGKNITCIAITLLFHCVSATAQTSPYINKVYEFTPAPGQFVNTIPAYEEGDTPETIAEKCTEAIANNNGELISLGSYGGYIIFGFDHTIENRHGFYDFKVEGNAFYATGNPNKDTTREGGSAEPGIVMVSRDTNGNGLPDDEWYELAGSEYSKEETIKGYSITYTRSDENKVKEPNPKLPAITDMTYCPWTDNQGESGYVFRNVYHKQSYWPQWIDKEEMTFTGTKLANNGIDESGKGTYWVLYCYDYGYADNRPNNDDRNRCSFNIDWAVDTDGNSILLEGIDFVKVYTAVNQYAGWIGETSTEISNAYDLHLMGDDVADDNITGIRRTTVSLPSHSPAFTVSGTKVTRIDHSGLYIVNGKKVLF